MSWDENPYYDPAKLGLVILAQMDEPNLSYQFNQFVVWQHIASGRVFYAQDSGCSCPTPFEDFDFNGPGATNLQEVQMHNWKAFEDEVNSFCAYPVDDDWYERRRIPQSEKDELLIKVKQAMKALEVTQ